ncbi:hypothetical protein [Brevundimonas sp. C43]|uniref:hypothetical protein n=1 Tax=Brevundimonas sp. C43 TaxID=3068314 RepID=UPI00273D2F7B|nr:hypothetical protein [Brevundimonas sp. C43]
MSDFADAIGKHLTVGRLQSCDADAQRRIPSSKPRTGRRGRDPLDKLARSLPPRLPLDRDLLQICQGRLSRILRLLRLRACGDEGGQSDSGKRH